MQEEAIVTFETTNFYKLILEYDGTSFHGWQVQPGFRTIQGVVTTILQTFLREKIQLTGAGRTDSGVHAKGQVASFATSNPMPIELIRKKLQKMLPRDISLVFLEKTSENFSARYQAISREYRYRVRKKHSAFAGRYSWVLDHDLDISRMKAACESLRGLHSFRAFARKMEDSEGYFCRMLEVDCTAELDEEELHFRFRADRFLYGMVRLLTASLVDIGRCKLDVDSLEISLESGIRPPITVIAPAHGLFLERVEY